MAPLTSSKLFQPLKVGNMELKHRVIMAPLTRFRATDAHVPILPMVKEYYTQRACVPGTLLITEATFISPQASGYANVPGLFEPAQLKAWKEITDAVHEKGSFIYCQLWALGRAATKAEMDKKGLDVVGASAVPISEKSAMPRELREEEIRQFIRDYADAAKAAVEVGGFDGVEIHGANGYLIDQFTQDVSNHRTDSWGGSVENRARFALEVARAVTEAVGSNRVGIRLSPFSTFQSMKMADPIPQLTYLTNGLSAIGLSYLHLVESRPGCTWKSDAPIFLAGGFSAQLAKEAADEYPGEEKGRDVGIVFGRFFISTPNLVWRLQKGLEFNEYNRGTFYKAQSEEGYTDYPFHERFLAESKL
ncbi:FMN-linked oxidoreductase [Tothia fuscella]|uniref:FMN-linked oxidoreductase n=1 Tax=Tothia fuscella TaxID=1048955 RepID=A0A9P4NV82_9PEZI|nr:FMN-linked oxidoreductase [Tothia fuscella]